MSAEAACATCGHSKSAHEVRDGYRPYGYCNHGHDLCGCKKYVPASVRAPTGQNE